MKKKTLYLILLTGLVLSVSILPLKACADSQSWKSWLIEQYFWLRGDKSYYDQQDEAIFDQYVKSSGEKSNLGFYLSTSDVNGPLKYDYVSREFQAYTWNDNEKPDQKVIFYLHGGSYLNNPSSYHIAALRKISEKLDAKIVLPIYPKAPTYHYHKAMPLLVDYYKKTLKETKAENLILMGDSAGGGLALGLALALKEEPEKPAMPKDIILLSPWLDVSMENPDIKQYESVDPILSAWGLERVGQLWSDHNVKHPYVSPIYGDMAGLPKITLFVGTHEIFYPDITKFAKQLADSKHPYELIVAEKMNHVYPIYPMPEAETAQNQIVSIIQQ
ncbi:alpha/beta hydrolase [Streptococcus sp. X16XC17]|uniref:alpha/beta hydrolase fold domain-containing protein n=1 Tax=unclassified Streptococcus TaxID=2608887 RepID=UPI00066FFF30|nr:MULTISPECIES: alpha/beta hydrolase [unclassified Streptococcus]TCD45834.1 alpha/beta hydrolase [Streptococcus sp. X16XC17]